MRNILLATSILVGLLFLVQSCYYENPPKPLPIELDDVSFGTHVLPIFARSCTQTECHEGTHEPNLLPENAYNSLANGYYNTTFPEESRIVKSVEYQGGFPMPPAGQLAPIDRDLILLWITKGAPND